MLASVVARLRARPPGPPADDDPSLLWAAVALILVAEPEEFLLICRAERAGDPWSGHLALPGGRRDDTDADLLATAVRETQEEVGVALGTDLLVGTLADVVPRTPVLPPIAIRPFVFLLPRRPALSLNVEVAAAEWVPVALLADPAARHELSLDIQGRRRQAPAYATRAGSVWGLTERILTSLIQA